MILSTFSLSQSAITLKLETQKSTLSQIDLKVTTNGFIKCLQEKDAHSLCMNVNCKQKNAAMCKYQQCLCKETHKSCIYVDINKLVHTIKKQAYPFEKIKTKIINIFDQAIDQLSQTQDQLLLKYQNLFQQRAFSKNEKILLSTLQTGQNKQKLTSNLIFNINTNIYHREKQNQIINDIVNEIDCISEQFMRKLSLFNKTIQDELLSIQNIFTDKQQQRIWGIFKGSSIIQKRQHERVLIKFFQSPVIDAKLLYKGSQNRFDQSKFKLVCESTQNILIILRTKKGKLIGGFTPSALPSTNWLKRLQSLKNEEFLFSISQKEKFPHHQKGRAMILGLDQGRQIFSFGHDFQISIIPNMYEDSFVNLQGAYRNQKFKQNKQGWMKFTGSSTKFFSVKEMEVWRVLFKTEEQIQFDGQ